MHEFLYVGIQRGQSCKQADTHDQALPALAEDEPHREDPADIGCTIAPKRLEAASDDSEDPAYLDFCLPRSQFSSKGSLASNLAPGPAVGGPDQVAAKSGATLFRDWQRHLDPQYSSAWRSGAER